jgi:hypothetical protein
MGKREISALKNVFFKKDEIKLTTLEKTQLD